MLFSDVDMIWYKDPLEYFHNKSSPMHNFDVYFQDDGSRGEFHSCAKKPPSDYWSHNRYTRCGKRAFLCSL